MMKPMKAISAMSAASSLSDAQIKSLLIPHVVASQRLGLFYHQRISFGAQCALRDVSFSSTLYGAGPTVALYVSPVTTFSDHQDDTGWKTVARGVKFDCLPPYPPLFTQAAKCTVVFFLLCHLNRRDFRIETHSMPFIRESIPFAKNKRQATVTDRKRGFAQKSPLHPHLAPRGEVEALSNDTHHYAKAYVASKEKQPAAESLYQQV